MGIRHVVQPYKGYSRDVESQWDNLGRVLVDMEQPIPEIYDADDDNIMDDAKQSKKKLLKEISKLLPSLPSRIQRLEKEKKELEERQQKEAATHKVASQKASISAKKKKGKKRR
jgi:signal recognition particle subunit SRP19